MNFSYLLRTVAIAVATFTTFSPSANALEVGTLSKAVQAEEARLGARIGMAVFDAKDRTHWAHRGDERFPLNSTHKSFSCAALLKQVDRRVLALENVISIERASLVTYSPVMEKTGGQVTLREACAASVSWSDNTAANIVTDAIGGPQAFTVFMRDIGDPHTRLHDTGRHQITCQRERRMPQIRPVRNPLVAHVLVICAFGDQLIVQCVHIADGADPDVVGRDGEVEIRFHKF